MDREGSYLFKKRSLPRRTRSESRFREERGAEGEGEERNKSLIAPSPLPDWGLFMDIC